MTTPAAQIRREADDQNRSLNIMLCAVEPSGDAIGADLIRSLRRKSSFPIRFFGCGGRQMEEKGLKSAFPIDAFSVIGLTGALRALPSALKHTRALAHIAAQENIEAAILIDGWAFSKMAATRIKAASPETKLYKFVGPQIWASRPRRIDKVKELFDGVLTLFSFENKYYETANIPVVCTGNPLFQKAAIARGDAVRFRAVHGLGDAPLLAVLMGSRKAELHRHAPPFRETVKRLVERFPDLRITAPLAPSIADEARIVMADWPGAPIFVEAGERLHAFAAADAGLATSGTVTTELAIQKTPMVIAYKVDMLTAMWVRAIVTTPYAALINIAAGRAVIPEFLQEDCTPQALAMSLGDLLSSPEAGQNQLDAFETLLGELGVGGPPAGDVAAQTILDWVRP